MKNLFRAVFLILLVGNVYAQQLAWPDSANARIEWQRQIHSPEDLNYQPSLTDRLSDFLFGESVVQLITPFNLVAIDNTCFVLDQANQALIMLNLDEGEITRFTPEEPGQLPSPVGICLAGDGELIISDSKLNRLFRFDIEQKEFSEFAPAIDLKRPTGLAYNKKNKTLWVVETGAHRIVVLNMQGEIVQTIGQRGTADLEFNFPNFISIDQSGTVYVIDAMNFRLQILSSEGMYLSGFGQIGDASGYFARPRGVAVDSNGNIYIADGLFHTVQIFDRKGRYLMRFGEQGRNAGQFWLPAGIFIDNRNRIFVADSYNARIQIFKYKGARNGE